MKSLFLSKKHRLVFGAFVFLLMLSVSFFIKPASSKALLGFGGRVMSITVCTCSFPVSLYIVLGPPTGGSYVLPIGLATPFEYYDVWGVGNFVTADTYLPSPLGNWLLGGYVTGGQCLVLAEPCYPLVPEGTVVEYGTSLPSAL